MQVAEKICATPQCLVLFLFLTETSLSDGASGSGCPSGPVSGIAIVGRVSGEGEVQESERLSHSLKAIGDNDLQTAPLPLSA